MQGASHVLQEVASILSAYNLNTVFSFEQVSTAKILGVTFRQDFKWNDHIDNINAKAAKRLYLLWELKRTGVSCNDLVLFYFSAIKWVLESSWMIFYRNLPRNLSEDRERCHAESANNNRISFPMILQCQILFNEQKLVIIHVIQ